eukprot:gene16210-17841_t
MRLPLLLVSMLTFASSYTTASDPYRRQLIVLSLPDNYYYAKNINDIAAFAKEFATNAYGYDEVLVLYPSKFITAGRYFDLGSAAKCLTVDEPIDLWMRDFGLVNPKHPVKFRYEPKYLSKVNSSWVDNSFRNFLYRHVAQFSTEQRVALDGGNVVDNGLDKAIITRRIFKENRDQSEQTVEQRTAAALGMEVAYIPDPLDTTGHADGIVSFVEKDTVMIADVGDEYFFKQIDLAIKNAFPDVTTVRLPCPDLKNSDWRKFRSAFGAYANSVVTDSSLYMPIFQRAKHDEDALKLMRKYSDRRVVTVDTSKLGHMGGNIRCMSWQIDYSHPIAQALLAQSVQCSSL